MKTFLISHTDIYHIIKQFCPFFNHDKTEIIYNISHIDNYNKSSILSIEKIEDLLEQTHLTNTEVEVNVNEYSENDTDIEEADF
jgi:ribosomal 30S subunit maturation factor RimM